MRQGRRRMIACILAACMALGVAVAAIKPTTARADEAAVRAVGEGVFKFNWRYKGDIYSRGSCFLINDRYVLTCWHCAMFSRDEREAIETQLEKEAGQELELDVRDFLDEFTYTVTVYRDMQKEAELVNYSEEEDWAIFKLKSAVGNSTPLKFRDSKTVEAAETIWSVGFPANSDLKVVNTYRPDDVTIKKGTVSKPEGMYDNEIAGGWHFKGNYLQTTCPISGGDSGGPMVDDNGNILGISECGNDDFYFCIADNSIMTALDRLKIEYKRIDGDTTENTDGEKTAGATSGGDDGSEKPGGDAKETYDLTEVKASLNKSIKAAEDKLKDEKKYEPSTVDSLKTALNEAKEAAEQELEDNTDKDAYDTASERIKNAKSDLDGALSGLQDNKGLSPAIIAGIVVGALALIGGIIAAIVAITKRNKNKAAAGVAPVGSQAGYNPASPNPAPVPGAMPAQPAPMPQNIPSAPGTTVFDEHAAGTTVLGDDAPPTDVLGESVDGGTLTRMSTNEKIQINRSEITLGRDRKSVDYCLEGNTNIGRVHARVIVRNGQVYIVDNNSTNGTFVNNAKLRAGLEQQLKSGDIIRLADEKFRYNK